MFCVVFVRLKIDSTTDTNNDDEVFITQTITRDKKKKKYTENIIKDEMMEKKNTKNKEKKQHIIQGDYEQTKFGVEIIIYQIESIHHPSLCSLPSLPLVLRLLSLLYNHETFFIFRRSYHLSFAIFFEYDNLSKEAK